MPTGLGDEQLWLSATNDNTGSSTAFDDLSGEGNDGTANGGMLVVADTSEGGTYAFDFDGTNDYIDCGSGFNPATNLSISAWINADTWSGGDLGARTVVEKGFDGTNEKFSMVARSNGSYLDWYTYLTPAEHGIESQVAPPSTANWHHVCGTFDGSTWRLFLNGVQVASDADSTTLPSSTQDVSIGATKVTGVPQRYFSGKMDDIRLFDRPLTQAEITHLASSRGVEGNPFSGLGDEQLWLCPSLSDSANDISGNGNDGAYVGGLTTTADTGNGGSRAYDLDTGSKGVTLPSDIISGLTEYSYGTWVKLNGGQASSSNILGGYDSGFAETNPTFFVGAADRLRVLGKSDSGATISYDIENPATSGVWKHLFFTYSERNGLRTYQDGVLIDTYTTLPVTGGDGTIPFAIGKSYHDATISLVDDTRVYYRELGSSEIAHLASSRGVQGSPYTSVGLGSEWGWWCPSLDDSGDDISGNGNNGNYLNGLTTIAETGSGGSLAYNIDDQLKGVDLDTSILLNEKAYTYSCWFKPDGTDTSGEYRRIFGAYGGGSPLSNILINQQDGALRMLAITDGGTTFNKVYTASVVAGEWYHLALIMTNKSANYYAGYLNGIPFEFFQYIGGIYDTGRTGLPFGIGGGGIGNFTGGAIGLIDDVRLYRKSLSDNEIEHLATSRGIQGKPLFNRVNIRQNLSYITDTDSFVACQPNSSTGVPPFTWEYDPDQGFGWIGQSISNFRDRSTSVPPQLAGIGYTDVSGVQFRMDLPEGPGTYRIFAAAYDDAANQKTGWDIHDGGTSGTLIGQMTQDTAGGLSTQKYVDITDAQVPIGDFDWENENGLVHNFTSDHVTWTRNTGVSSGTGVLSSAWLELVGPLVLSVDDIDCSTNIDTFVVTIEHDVDINLVDVDVNCDSVSISQAPADLLVDSSQVNANCESISIESTANLLVSDLDVNSNSQSILVEFNLAVGSVECITESQEASVQQNPVVAGQQSATENSAVNLTVDLATNDAQCLTVADSVSLAENSKLSSPARTQVSSQLGPVTLVENADLSSPASTQVASQIGSVTIAENSDLSQPVLPQVSCEIETLAVSENADLSQPVSMDSVTGVEPVSTTVNADLSSIAEADVKSQPDSFYLDIESELNQPNVASVRVTFAARVDLVEIQIAAEPEVRVQPDDASISSIGLAAASIDIPVNASSLLVIHDLKIDSLESASHVSDASAQQNPVAGNSEARTQVSEVGLIADITVNDADIPVNAEDVTSVVNSDILVDGIDSETQVSENGIIANLAVVNAQVSSSVDQASMTVNSDINVDGADVRSNNSAAFVIPEGQIVGRPVQVACNVDQVSLKVNSDITVNNADSATEIANADLVLDLPVSGSQSSTEVSGTGLVLDLSVSEAEVNSNAETLALGVTSNLSLDSVDTRTQNSPAIVVPEGQLIITGVQVLTKVDKVDATVNSDITVGDIQSATSINKPSIEESTTLFTSSADVDVNADRVSIDGSIDLSVAGSDVLAQFGDVQINPIYDLAIDSSDIRCQLTSLSFGSSVADNMMLLDHKIRGLNRGINRGIL